MQLMSHCDNNKYTSMKQFADNTKCARLLSLISYIPTVCGEDQGIVHARLIEKQYNMQYNVSTMIVCKTKQVLVSTVKHNNCMSEQYCMTSSAVHYGSLNLFIYLLKYTQ